MDANHLLNLIRGENWKELIKFCPKDSSGKNWKELDLTLTGLISDAIRYEFVNQVINKYLGEKELELVKLRCQDCKSDIEIIEVESDESIFCLTCNRNIMRMFWVNLNN